MGSPSQYWQCIRIDAAGKRQVEPIAAARAFFRQQFPKLAGQTQIPDSPVQRRLLQLVEDDTGTQEQRQLAEICLRCFISHQIAWVCVDLAERLGPRHGFCAADLLPFVLDDDLALPTGRGVETASQGYRSLACEILQSFNPDRSSLGTWTVRMVRHHRELNAILLEHGVYLVSDWAILNDTTLQQLQRILPDFFDRTPLETQQAQALLKSYHLVYRRDRLRQRQAGSRGQCLPPTPEQLQRIAAHLRTTAAITWSSEQVLQQLQALAQQLRQYRVYSRGGPLPTQSLDNLEQDSPHRELPDPKATPTLVDEQEEFLTYYRQQFLQSLDQAVETVIGDRLAVWHRQQNNPSPAFLTALYLFHCQGLSMGEIAQRLGLKAQYQVSRLLKLKEFRADVRHCLLSLLRDRILTKARDYANPKQLHRLDQRVDAALREQVTEALQQAEAEARIAKNRPLTSLFAHRLCLHLDTRSAEP